MRRRKRAEESWRRSGRHGLGTVEEGIVREGEEVGVEIAVAVARTLEEDLACVLGEPA